MDSLPVGKVIVGERCRRDLGDVDALARSIADIGLLHPIVITPERRLVAGERRLEAAKSLGWKTVPVAVVGNLLEAEKLLRAERDENTCRKDLAPTEVAVVDERLRPFAEAEAAARKAATQGRPRKTARKLHTVSGPRRSAAVVASAVGVSARTLEKIRAVTAAAKASPETFSDLPAEMDRTGKVDKAYGELRKRQKREALKKAADTAPTSAMWDCRLGDFRLALADIPDASVALVFTDPPWDDATAQRDYADLFSFANRVLVDGGSLVAYAGHNALPVVLSQPNPLRYWWTLAAVQDRGRTARLPGKWVLTEWRPLLWFVKGGRRDNEYMVDVIRVGRDPAGKDAHDWSQPEETAGHCIRVLTKPGEVVVDPFLGGGTTGVAAVREARRFVGCDIDAETVTVAKGRIALAQTA